MNMFKEFLGETPKRKDVIAISSATTVLVSIIIYKNNELLSELAVWKIVLFATIAFDIVAGAIANYTESTQRYYGSYNSKRVTFLIMHVAILYLAVGYLWFCLIILVYTIVSSLIVNFTKTLKQQEINTAMLAVIGSVLFFVIFPTLSLLLWFPMVIMLKLIIGFAVKREM